MGKWREYLIEKLADRERAIGYLQAILDDYYIYGGTAVVRDALDTVVEAQGSENSNLSTDTVQTTHEAESPTSLQ